MAMQELEIASSSQIGSASYDDETGELQITFTNGSLYSYPSPGVGIVEGLKSATSPGSYWNRVKGGLAHVRLG